MGEEVFRGGTHTIFIEFRRILKRRLAGMVLGEWYSGVGECLCNLDWNLMWAILCDIPYAADLGIFIYPYKCQY